jgi:hypothetical protein
MRIGFDAKRAFQNFTGLGNYSRFIIESLLASPTQHEYFAYTPKLNSKVQFDKDCMLNYHKPLCQNPCGGAGVSINN